MMISKKGFAVIGLVVIVISSLVVSVVGYHFVTTVVMPAIKKVDITNQTVTEPKISPENYFKVGITDKSRRGSLEILVKDPAGNFITDFHSITGYQLSEDGIFILKPIDVQAFHNLYVAMVVDPPGSLAGQVAYWKFDEASGTTASDSWGNGHTGTISGATPESGKFGNALKFDGVDDYVAVPKSSRFKSAQGTIAFWMKANSATAPSGDNEDLINIFQNDYKDYVLIRRDKYNGIYLGIDDDNDGTNNPEDTKISARFCSGKLADTNWHHIAVTQDGTGPKIYIDGIMCGVAVNLNYWTNHLNFSASSAGVRIGKGAWGSFPGTIDEVKIWNRALTADEIKAAMNGGVVTVNYCDDFLEGVKSLKFTNTYIGIFSGQEQTVFGQKDEVAGCSTHTNGDYWNAINKAAVSLPNGTENYRVLAIISNGACTTSESCANSDLIAEAVQSLTRKDINEIYILTTDTNNCRDENNVLASTSSAIPAEKGGCYALGDESASAGLNVGQAAGTPTTTPTAGAYTLTVTNSRTDWGTVTATGISCGTDCSESYPSGTVTLTAQPAPGYLFGWWGSGPCSGPGNPCVFNLNGDNNIIANFYTRVCSGQMNLVMSPNTIPFHTSQTLQLTVSGWSGCDDEMIYLKYQSCIYNMGTINIGTTSCPRDATSCTAYVNVYKEPGTYQYCAVLDLTGDGDFDDTGERADVTLTVTS